MEIEEYSIVTFRVSHRFFNKKTRDFFETIFISVWAGLGLVSNLVFWTFSKYAFSQHWNHTWATAICPISTGYTLS